MMEEVCVDASLALSWVLPMDINVRSEALFQGWAREGTALLGPPLLYAETVSVIRNKVFRRLLTVEEGGDALELFFAYGVRAREPAGLYRQAFALATELRRPQAYDAQYVALAQIQGCELWTADRRLHAAFGPRCPWVKLVQ
ncbi:MAG: PIN domain-containing protein [Dehalococcoidia bacterium]|nr:PIN domain-containing protein [Dehalococcoidia bacterium]